MSVEACSVPVDPMSTSASPPPKIRLPVCCSAASITPWKVGVEPNGPVHRLVPLMSQPNPTMPIVPSPAMEISGSLFPSGRNSCVLEKVRLPLVVALNATTTVTITTPNTATSDVKIFLRFILLGSFLLQDGHILAAAQP